MRQLAALDATILIGLDAMTIPLLRQLTTDGPGNRIVVIEPDGRHPLLEAARGTGAHIVVADPTSRRVLMPLLRGLRGPQLRYLFALRPLAAENQDVLDAAKFVLSHSRADDDRPPHLIARIDDPRQADLWRGRRIGQSSLWFEDALSPPASTASAVVNLILRTSARQVLLCGDGTLALAILLELAHRAWERQGLAAAAASSGRAAPSLPPHPPGQVLLLTPRAEDLRREYLATSPKSFVEVLPEDHIRTGTGAWRDQLLASLDAMTPAQAAGTAVVVADTPTEASMHEAGRVARLHPETPVLVLSSDGGGDTRVPVLDKLQPFQRALLVDGQAPEDTWTRIARHWHECCRLAHPAVPGGATQRTHRPWADLDQFTREDNILQLRSVMAAVAALGRSWVPVRTVAPGSFVELSQGDLAQVAREVHSRWCKRRRADGWRAAAAAGMDDDNARVNRQVRPWADLPAQTRTSKREDLRSQVEQLEAVGFMPILPLRGPGGPDGAADFRRIGEVQAERLTASQQWRSRSGDELSGTVGDWHVTDDAGDARTVRNAEFLASHQALGSDRWRRTSTVRAWQVRETVAVRTLEGRAVARPGDWIVQGPGGVRWPVTNEHFTRGHEPGAAGGS